MKLTRAQFFQSLFGGVAVALGPRKSPNVGQVELEYRQSGLTTLFTRPRRISAETWNAPSPVFRKHLGERIQFSETWWKDQPTGTLIKWSTGEVVYFRKSPHERPPFVKFYPRPWPWEPLGESTVRQVAREMKDFDRDLNNLRDQAGVSVEKS